MKNQSISDRDIINWDQRLGDHVKRKWENYIRRRIDLTESRENEQWPIAGEFIYIEDTSDASASASIRLDKNTAPALDLEKGTRIETVFETIFISNDAQASAWIDIIIGINFEYFKPSAGATGGTAQAVVNLTHANPNTDVAAGSQSCNEVLIKADVQNTGIAWIDFGQAAVQDDCLPLDPGESVRVSLSNLDQIHANFEVGGEVVFILYEL